MAKTLIIIPTYNEAENVVKIIPDILEVTNNSVDILIVDDNSPDRTADIVMEMQKTIQNLYLLHRSKKSGLGTAYCAGFDFAIKNEYDYIFEMDADYSHDPKDIPAFLEKIIDNDLVIGSRYIGGIRVLNWPIKRVLLSTYANFYTRIITGMKIIDATGGYKCFRRKVLESIDLKKIKSNGYAFQIEMNFKALKKGFRLAEIPIIFYERAKGKSKMSKKIVFEAAWMVWKLRIQSILKILN